MDVDHVLTFLDKSNFPDCDWKELGQQLMITPAALKTIQVNRPGEPNICLLDIVSWWLRSDKEATWEKLVEAVKEKNTK